MGDGRRRRMLGPATEGSFDRARHERQARGRRRSGWASSPRLRGPNAFPEDWLNALHAKGASSPARRGASGFRDLSQQETWPAPLPWTHPTKWVWSGSFSRSTTSQARTRASRGAQAEASRQSFLDPTFRARCKPASPGEAARSRRSAGTEGRRGLAGGRHQWQSRRKGARERPRLR
jgi:hypothetical protein